MSRTGRIASLLLFVAICLGVGALASVVTAGSVSTWYPALDKPAWTPPPWLFGPVWTLLYIAMGWAGWLAWSASRTRPGRVLVPFAIQLALNAAWSFIFFGARLPGWAWLEILLLWLAIGWTIAVFHKVRRPAAWLLTPYLAWVTFAAALNFSIWRLNA